MASKEQQLDRESTSGDRFARVPPGFEATKVDGRESHGPKYRFYELDVDDRVSSVLCVRFWRSVFVFFCFTGMRGILRRD